MDLSKLRTIRIAACDLNGQMRGKRMPVGLADKLDDGSARMPISTLNVDLWGRDVEDNPLVFETGDADNHAADRPGSGADALAHQSFCAGADVDVLGRWPSLHGRSTPRSVPCARPL